VVAEETTVHRVLADASRVRILSLLDTAARPLGVAELSEATGLHANTVRGHLALLEETGFVVSRTEPRDRPGRPRHVYVPVPRRAEHDHALLAAALTSSLDPLPDGPALAEASGRSWGRLLTPPLPEGVEPTEEATVAHVSALLAERGFAPAVSGRELVMRRCPFEELAARYPHIVCTLHRGLIDGSRIHVAEVPLELEP
jgi:predicted ArsR family transcriptional regulator